MRLIPCCMCAFLAFTVFATHGYAAKSASKQPKPKIEIEKQASPPAEEKNKDETSKSKDEKKNTTKSDDSSK